MDINDAWPSALRLVWLTGGLVAVSEPQDREVRIMTYVNGRTIAAFQLKTYGSLFGALRLLGFLIIGSTFVTDPEQTQGLRAPEFRANGTGGWPVWNALQSWGQIASAAARKDEMRLMDVASRIATGLEYSEMRLYDLAMSYSAQLHSHLKSDEPKPYQAFKDTMSPSVYKDIHALFWEMAVLRDAIAEFIAVFGLKRDDATTLSGVLRSLKRVSSADGLAIEILTICDGEDPSGWLGRFGAYRDCFTHSAPLEQVRGTAFAVQDLLILKDGALVPQIYFPLPKNPAALMRDRARGTLFKTLKEMAHARAGQHDRSQEPDALEYLHRCLCQLTELSLRLVARSPIAPQPIVITRADIIGQVKITGR